MSNSRPIDSRPNDTAGGLPAGGPQALGPLALIFDGALWVYQAAVSPLFGPCCRFVPSCSAYAREAVRRYGLVRGGWMAMKRILRCHPLHSGGWDPVS